jgi:two-component system, NtrC family, sensor kinase
MQISPSDLGNLPGNIMIVDDQLDNLRLLTEILTAEGFKVRKAVNGNRALEAAQLAPPDLILLDIMMPEMNGYQVCQHLKADARTQDIPLIFLSALDDIDDKINAFSLGAVDYITKPFQREEVLARVKTHLKIQGLTQALQQQNKLLSTEIQQRQTSEAALVTALANLKIAQEKIIAREKLAALGTLTAGIAHELRNPLNFVNNYAEGSIELADELGEEFEKQLNISKQPPLGTLEIQAVAIVIQKLLAELRANAVAIHQHGQRAVHVINSMMQHVRMEHSTPQLTNLHCLLDEAWELAYHSKRLQTPEFKVSIVKEYDPDIEQLPCFISELRRAVLNLLDNAFYAVEQKQQALGSLFLPEISIQSRKQAETIEIRIRDNGLGIQAPHHPKIFEPFFTTKPTNQGTGLGLSMTYEIIVGQHGGNLTLSTEPGEFAEFILTLPILGLNPIDLQQFSPD